MGTAATMASTVPHSAMCSVITISRKYIRQSLKSGGKKSAANVRMLAASLIKSRGRISAPCQAQARTPAATSQIK